MGDRRKRTTEYDVGRLTNQLVDRVLRWNCICCLDRERVVYSGERSVRWTNKSLSPKRRESFSGICQTPSVIIGESTSSIFLFLKLGISCKYCRMLKLNL